MPRQSSKGICFFCGGTFGKIAMSRHVAQCPQRLMLESGTTGKRTSAPTRNFHLLVEGSYSKEYWLYLATRADATLENLDQYLRDIWLECCGHLSAFTINDRRYISHQISSKDYDLDERSMRSTLAQLAGPRMAIEYEYDFGTTTELTIKVLGEHEGDIGRRPILLLARNEPPPLPCHVCGQPATELCTECYDETGVLCEEHAGEHAHDEEMFLPVVNSPRMGVCGYTGPTKDVEAQYAPRPRPRSA